MQDKVVFLFFFYIFFNFPSYDLNCLFNARVITYFFVVYKMVNAAYIVLRGQMSDALLIVIYCSVYICSG